MSISGNKGEWSEIYVLLRLLGQKELHLGDEDLNKVKGLVYPIIEILRKEGSTSTDYIVETDLIIVFNKTQLIKISVKEFAKRADELFLKIKSTTGNFSDPQTESFLKTINCNQLKADSTNKTDITIVIHDEKTGLSPSLGFSIKSQLGSPSTLLNASGATNFVFKISSNSLTDGIVNRINSEKSFAKKFKLLNNYKCRVDFFDLSNNTFKNNLILVDSKMPEIMGRLILKYYSSSDNNLKDLTDIITKEDPLKFGNDSGHPFYHYKIKKLLTDYALGMMASKVWTGIYESTGGYLVVKNSGEILCYHFYYKNQFENYLLANTKFETASTTRHGFGSIYKENGQYFIKLNLQIRFIV